MKRFRFFCVVAVLLGLGGAAAARAADLPWRVGVATRTLTPPGPIWLAGYANRTAPSNGVALDLHGKALALDDGAGGRLVIVTLDLIGVPAALRAHTEKAAAEKFGLKPHEVLLNASHTHSGPQVSPDRMMLERAFRQNAKPADVAAVDAFETFLRAAVLDLIGESLQSAAPARLEFSTARAGFAMNRRRPERNGTITNNPYPAGPVDHEVPVLKITGADGKPRALLFGYACHNTTLSGSQISGDYAGHAQKFLEASYPGATALFLMGCAGDQNPYPRGAMVPGQSPDDLASQHGRALANAVVTALATRPRPLAPPLRSAYGHAQLDYTPLADAALARYRAPEHTPPVIERARALQESLRRGERPAPLACPVQVVQFGGDLTLVALGGEPVIDYALRLKRELAGPASVWVAGYSNDYFGYLGSKRVIAEGGYEGGEANTRILNHPGPFAPDAEDRVVAKVHELLAAPRR